MRGTAASLLILGAGLIAPCGAVRAQQTDRADTTLITGERAAPAEPEFKRIVPLEIDEAPSPRGLPSTDVFVGAVTISGLRALAPADFSDLVAARIGRSLSPAELSALTDAIAQRLQARGYTFASAWIDPQRVANGVLTVSVDEGRIDELRFEGEAPPAVRHALAPLADGRPARIEEVERRLLIAGDVEGVRIRSTRYLREGRRGVLLVQATQERVTLRAGLTNQGTRPVGREQARIELDLNGLLASDDSLTLTYLTAPAQPRELQFGRARYAKRISASGSEVALSGSLSVTHPGAYLRPLDLRNRTWTAAASVMQPLLRRRRASFWVEGELGLRDLVQWRRDVRARHDRIVTARLTLSGNAKVAGGRLRMSSTLSQGLGLLDATEPGDLLASRRDANGTFTTLSAWTDWTTDLGSNFSLRLAAQGQLAAQPLLISEEASLGGSTFLRGYDWGERTGDEGVMGSAEVRYLLEHPFGFAKRAQLYAFLDGGTVTNLKGGFGGGSLASAGGGVRMDLTAAMGASFEVAVPLSGERYDTGDESPKLNFSVVRSF